MRKISSSVGMVRMIVVVAVVAGAFLLGRVSAQDVEPSC